jgi:hypothetical protein
VEKYRKVREAMDEKRLRRMHVACWITKAKNTHSEYLILLGFTMQNGYSNATQYYVYTFISFPVLLEDLSTTTKTLRPEPGTIQNTKQICISPQNFLKQRTFVRYYIARTNLALSVY